MCYRFSLDDILYLDNSRRPERVDDDSDDAEYCVPEDDSETSNRRSRIGESDDIFYDIDTSRTGQDGFTYSTEYDADQEIARLQKEFQDKQIAIKMDHERRMVVMRKRFVRQMDATYSGRNAEDDNYETPPKKPYEFTETKYTGLCIIINNNTRYSRAAASLREFFATKGYEVEFHDSPKKEEMKSIFDSLKSKDFDNYGCFVCFVLSTGNDTHIETADNLSIKMRKIVKYFNPNDCPKLDGKPKVFFFQNGIDFYDAKNLWEADDNETTPFPTYADAFVVRSTLRDFIDRFVTILKDYPGKSLSTIMTVLQSETLSSFTSNEQYQAISTMAKEVYLAAQKSEVKTSNTRVIARIHAPAEKELNELTEEKSTLSSPGDIPHTSAHVHTSMSKEKLVDTGGPVEGGLSVTE
uniref:uncharacterized protein LOC120333219 n=1 Tax=Styela clava TaxID=7725 RepID=UPI00193A8A77|nr:uncharacterized protein LOC120333219 [Styela clava]